MSAWSLEGRPKRGGAGSQRGACRAGHPESSGGCDQGRGHPSGACRFFCYRVYSKINTRLWGNVNVWLHCAHICFWGNVETRHFAKA